MTVIFKIIGVVLEQILSKKASGLLELKSTTEKFVRIIII